MAACVDCGSGTPHNEWKRCEACAMTHLRHTMSGGQVPLPSSVVRGYARGVRVFVIEPIEREGVVQRCRDGKYTIRFADGAKCHVDASMLRPAVLEEPEANKATGT